MIKLIALRLLENFFRHRWLYLLAPTLMLAAGIAFATLVPQEYEASGTMMIEKESLLATLTSNGNAATMWRTPASITVGELQELLATDAFVRAAIAKTGLEAQMGGDQQSVRQTFDEFRNSLLVVPLGDKLMEVRATHADPALAQQIAAATVDSYIQWQINKGYQESVVAQGFFANLIAPLQEELQTARDNMQVYLENYPEPLRGERPPEEQMEIARLASEITRSEERLTETLKAEEQARLALAKSESITRQTYLVIDNPVLPEFDFSLIRAAIIVVAFTMVGVFLSLAALAVNAVLDRTLRWPVDVRQALNLPLLATLGSDTPKGARRTATRPAAEERAAPRTDVSNAKSTV
jgi:uncharacterized protein involved in exopolysaccharide biosynthesis